MKSTCYAVLLTAFLFFGCLHNVLGQSLLTEDFGYPAGDLLTNHDWISHSSGGTQPITVNSSGLSFPGYGSSGIGNAALADNTGEDDNRAFTAQTSGTIYVGFMVKVVANSAGYFLHIGPSPIGTTYRGKVFTDAGNHFGVSVVNNTGTFATSTFTVGSTYLLVLKYEIVSGTTNDKVSLFIFNSSAPSTEPTVPDVGPLTDAAAADITPACVAIRQFSSTQNFIIDGIRVSKTWSEMIGVPISAPSTQASNLTFSNVTGSSITAGWTPGNGEKRLVIINTNSSIDPPVNGTDPAANAVYGGTGQQVVYNGSGNNVQVTGLQSNIPYWFQVFEYNGSGANTLYCTATGAGNPASQTTQFVLTSPVVTSPVSSSISTTSATLGGTIVSDGGSPVIERGTVWSVNSPVTILDNKLAEGGTSTGAFTQLRNTLPPGTEIFFAAYATNSVGTTLSSQASFSTLAIEPSSQVTNLESPLSYHTSVTVTWNNNDGSQPADGFLILANTTGVFTAPSDGVVLPNDSILVDGSGVVNVSHSLQMYTWYGLTPLTTYYFAIFPYTNSGSSIDYKTGTGYPQTTVTTAAIPVYTYTWSGADNASWNTASNWSPPRNIPASNDILEFSDGTTKTVVDVPTQTVGKLVMANNTKITLQTGAAANITVAGLSGSDLIIPAGCELALGGTNAITLTVPSGATGDISGTMTFANGSHRLISGSASGVIFNSNSTFKAATGFIGNPFGTAAPYNAVVFSNGATYISQAGSNPFGAAAPNSVVTFNPGSLFKIIASVSPSLSGRTYGNFMLDSPGSSLSPSGSSSISIQDLTIVNGTLNFNLTGSPGHSIKGNISVESGGNLNFLPTSAGTVNLNGTASQAITVNGTFSTGANSTLVFENPYGVNLAGTLSISGGITLNGCLFTLGSGNLHLGTNATVAGTFSATNMIVADGSGSLYKEFPSTGGTFTYPVGDNTLSPGYSPVTLSFGSGTFASGNAVGVSLSNSVYPGSPPAASYINRYWNISSTGVSSFTCDANFSFVSPDDVTGTESEISCVRIAPEPAEVTGTVNAILHHLNAPGITSFGSFTGSQLDKNLSIALFLEGLYLGSGVMTKAQNETGDQFPGNIADVVSVELHNPAPGSYNVVEFSTGPVGLNTSGSLSVTIPSVHSGNYYLTVKHRNSIETVSSMPVSFAGNTISYNFTDAASKAYGENQKQAVDGTFMIYSGDVNQDGIVDSGDMIAVDNDGNGFVTGYISTDVNGDGLVDLSDMMTVDNNGGTFVSAIYPN